MTLIVPHRATAEKAIETIDHSWNRLFEGIGGSAVQLTDQQKQWDGQIMSFSLNARLGFIAVPLSGTVAVDDTNITVECALPAIVEQFIGEERVRGGIEKHVRGLLNA